MSTTKDLTRAFDALERTVSDTEADTAFAELTTRIDRRARRRAYGTALGGLTVAGLAVAAGLTLADSAGRPAGSGTTASGSVARASGHAATRAPALHQVAFSTRLATAAGGDGITRPVISVDAGWLPSGATLDGAAVDHPAGDDGSKRWAVPYPDGQTGRDGQPDTYNVTVELDQRDELPDHVFLSASGTDLTVAGHPARLFSSDFFTSVFVDLGGGQVADAVVASDPAHLDREAAVAAAEHVAARIRTDQRQPLPVTAVLTSAPAGDTIVSAGAGLDPDYPSTYYQLNDVDGGAEVGIGNLAEKYPAPIVGEPGRDVQGRPSVVLHANGRTILYVKGLFGEFTKVFSGKGAETLDDLYRIADGIRSVG